MVMSRASTRVFVSCRLHVAPLVSSEATRSIRLRSCCHRLRHCRVAHYGIAGHRGQARLKSTSGARRDVEDSFPDPDLAPPSRISPSKRPQAWASIDARGATRPSRAPFRVSDSVGRLRDGGNAIGDGPGPVSESNDQSRTQPRNMSIRQPGAGRDARNSPYTRIRGFGEAPPGTLNDSHAADLNWSQLRRTTPTAQHQQARHRQEDSANGLWGAGAQREDSKDSWTARSTYSKWDADNRRGFVGFRGSRHERQNPADDRGPPRPSAMHASYTERSSKGGMWPLSDASDRRSPASLGSSSRPSTSPQHANETPDPATDESESLATFSQNFHHDEHLLSANRGNKPMKSFQLDFETKPIAPTSKRRMKEDKATRRAEKFSIEDDAEADDLLRELKEKEEERRQRRERKKEAVAAKLAKRTKRIELPPFINVVNLATLLKVRPQEFAAKLKEFGFESFDNEHVLNFENASLIAMEYGLEPMVDRSDIEDLKARPLPEDVTLLPQRPPVVTIMGHVDHGKTTLLDYMRSTSVAASEHGGITQHIGAFSVAMANGKLVTFLDTPGHAAFLSMRQRGANVTDMVVLVVAADDSVKPQTIEAIKHARSAKVPIIVAINKVDKDEADVEKVKQDLLIQEIEVEDYGGDVQAIPVSGKTGIGLDALEEAIATQAELLDMRSETDGPVEGWILEATTKRAGRIATVLVRRGTLRPGNVLVAGTTWTRVRTLKNEAGLDISAAPPGTPVEVDGWRDQPFAGAEVLEAPSEQKASSVVEYRESRMDQVQAAIDMDAINESRRAHQERRETERAQQEAALEAARAAGEKLKKTRGKTRTNDDLVVRDKTELYILIKADVSGSAEAIEGSIRALPLSNQPLSLTVLRSGVGQVSEFDIDHISAVPAGHGFIISFNQQIPPNIQGDADRLGVQIVDQNIIYKVVDDVRAICEAKLPPVITRRVTGEAEVLQIFNINVGGRKIEKVAGCRVRNGVLSKGGKISVFRGAVGDAGSLVHEGSISTLKSQKKDIREMPKGNECGVGVEAWEGFEPGDIIQAYEEKSEQRRLLG